MKHSIKTILFLSLLYSNGYTNSFISTKLFSLKNVFSSKKKESTKTRYSSYSTIHSKNKLAKFNGYYFSYDHDVTDTLCKVITQTTNSIDGALFLITCKKLYAALEYANARNVKIRLIVDKKQAQQEYSMISKLLYNTSAQIYIPQKNNGLMHHKFTIYDNTTIIDGSFNWSNAANKTNQENISIEQNSIKVSCFQSHFEKLLTRCTKLPNN